MENLWRKETRPKPSAVPRTTWDSKLIVMTTHDGVEPAVVGIADTTLHALGLPSVLLPPHDVADSLRNQLAVPS